MSFPFYKPLMPPKPRRRDRRGAARTERLQEVLLWPDQTSHSTRDPDAKREAFARLQAQYAPEKRTLVVPIVMLALVVAVSALAAQEFSQSRHLVAYESARGSYDQLAVEAAASCGDEICGFGWFDEPPTDEMKRLMSVVRARRITYDPWTATTSIRGAHNAAFRLVHESASLTPDQARARGFAHWQTREQRTRAEAKGWGNRIPTREVLGNGWYVVWSP